MTYNSNLHMFPEQCVKYLKEKFHLGELNVRELMYVMKRIGIKTFKVHTNGSVYDVFLRRDINGVQDFEFINTLVQHRKEKRIKDEWANEPLSDYTPEMTNMKNASDDLLKNDDVYFENENRKFMRQDNKKLYESIMASVAKEVKKVLNEDEQKQPSFLDIQIAFGDAMANWLFKNYNVQLTKYIKQNPKWQESSDRDLIKFAINNIQNTFTDLKAYMKEVKKYCVAHNIQLNDYKNYDLIKLNEDYDGVYVADVNTLNELSQTFKLGIRLIDLLKRHYNENNENIIAKEIIEKFINQYHDEYSKLQNVFHKKFEILQQIKSFHQ